MKKLSYFKCPNALICDDRLSYTARRVGCVLFAYSNAAGTCKKAYREIARIAGVSIPTVAEAIRALADCGYLTFETTKRYHRAISGVGYGKNTYTVNLEALEDGYTRIKRDVFHYELPDSTFLIYATILVYMGNERRAWPSITKLQKAAGAARSTVCAGLKLLKKLPTLLVQLCQKRNGAFAASSYHSATVFVSPVSYTAEPADSVGADPRPSSHFYFTIKKLLLQGIEHIFSYFWVVRNFAN